MITVCADLRPDLLDVHDQGRRRTCLAIASTVAHEHLIGQRQPLSAEYLFYQAVTLSAAGDPDRGSSMEEAARALSQEGQPAWSAWPYQPIQMYGSDWKPPSFNSETYKVVMTYGTMVYEQITGALDNGRIVVLGLFITDAFIRCDASGVVADVSDDPERSGHAVLAVGYGLDKKGTNYLLIRNSWGSGWGISGHAWMSKQYIARQVCETAIVG